MLPLGLIFPGVDSAIAGVGMLAVASTAIYAFRKKIPHPTEFWIIGIWFRWLGIHTHDAFDLIIDLHTISNLKPSKSYYVVIESGRFEAQSAAGAVDAMQSILEVYQRVPIHVRQKDNEVAVKLYRKSMSFDELIGVHKIDVKRVLIECNFPKKIVIDYLHDGQRAAQGLVSFYEQMVLPYAFEGTVLNNPSIVQQLIIQSEADNLNLDVKSLVTMDLHAQIGLVARLLEGPLYIMNREDGASKFSLVYFKATTTRGGDWIWAYWSSHKDLKAKRDPKGTILIASMKAVIKNNSAAAPHEFFLRYAGKHSVKSLYFKRADRERSLWVDSLYIVIEMVHEYMRLHGGKTVKSESSHAKVAPLSVAEMNATQVATNHPIKTVSMKLHQQSIGNESASPEAVGSPNTMMLYRKISTDEIVGAETQGEAKSDEATNLKLYDDPYDDVVWLNDPDLVSMKTTEEVQKQHELYAYSKSVDKSEENEQLLRGPCTPSSSIVRGSTRRKDLLLPEYPSNDTISSDFIINLQE